MGEQVEIYAEETALWLHWDQHAQVLVQQQLRMTGMQEQQICLGGDCLPG